MRSTLRGRCSREAGPAMRCCILRSCSRMHAPRSTPRWFLRAGACCADVRLETAMLWIKSLHIIFMVTWFAGLFYLPRLFVYHALAEDRPSIERFKVMERKLFWGIMTPGGVLTIAFGLWLWLGWFRGEAGETPRWLLAKLALVTLLVG